MMRRSDGNTEKFTGCRMYIETSRIMIESVMFRLIRRSIIMVGIGSTMTSSIPITPTGITKWRLLRIFERVGSADFSAILIDFSDLLNPFLSLREVKMQFAFHRSNKLGLS
jgi:hypothetical protein